MRQWISEADGRRPEAPRPPRTRITAIATAASVIAFVASACGGGEGASSTDSAVGSSPTPSETISTATPEQVASIIAGQQDDWLEAIEEAGECRFTWTMGEGPVDEANGMSCYMREVTMGLTARTAIKDLGALTVPDSMKSLVTETTTALQSVAEIDLESLCGDALKGPMDSKACDRALGNRMWAYSALEDALDKWGPYL